MLKMYFCGNDVDVFIKINNKYELLEEVFFISWQKTIQKQPIYGYDSVEFDAVASGVTIINCNIGLNTQDIMVLNELKNKDLYIRIKHNLSNKNIGYVLKKLYNIQFSTASTIQSQQLMEQYSFIATDIEYVYNAKNKQEDINLNKLEKPKSFFNKNSENISDFNILDFVKDKNKWFNKDKTYSGENVGDKDKQYWKVIDGDTIKLYNESSPGKAIRTIRLANINSTDDQTLKFKHAAGDYLQKLIGGADSEGKIYKSISIVYNNSNKEGHYGRQVGTLIADDGTVINGKMVEDGYALPYNVKDGNEYNNPKHKDAYAKIKEKVK